MAQKKERIPVKCLVYLVEHRFPEKLQYTQIQFCVNKSNEIC